MFACRTSVMMCTQQFAMPIPRVTESELQNNATLRTGLHPYILTGLVNTKWKAANWTLDYLATQIPFEWVDYYEKNLDTEQQRPFLLKFEDALPRFKKKSDIPRYMQLRLGLQGWDAIRHDLEPKPDPQLFWDDDGWIAECMSKDGKPDREAIDNFFKVRQWKFLLIGDKGASMFLHKDATISGSWQGQLMGRKKWTLCPNDQSRFLNPKIKTFDENARDHPTFSKAYCGRVTVEQGELIYYPGYWWHHTLNLDTPTMAYTGALVGTETDRDDIGPERRPHYMFHRDMIRELCKPCWEAGNPRLKCQNISLKWPGAAPPILRITCDDYLEKCLHLWDKHAKTLSTTSSTGQGTSTIVMLGVGLLCAAGLAYFSRSGRAADTGKSRREERKKQKRK